MRALTTVAGVAIGALLLSGCLPQQPTATPPPEATAAPIFASDEEALAAATAAYAAYQSAVDSALATYSTSVLSEVAAGRALKAAVESVQSFQADGKRLVGSSSIETIMAVQMAGLADVSSGDPAQIYSCLDISMTDVVDSAGASLVDKRETRRVATLVSLIWNDDPAGVLVSEVEVWDGNDFCN